MAGSFLVTSKLFALGVAQASQKKFLKQVCLAHCVEIRLAARMQAQSIETKGVRSGNELVSRRWDRMGDYKKIPLDHKVSRCRAECLCESSLKLVTDENLASNRLVAPI